MIPQEAMPYAPEKEDEHTTEVLTACPPSIHQRVGEVLGHGWALGVVVELPVVQEFTCSTSRMSGGVEGSRVIVAVLVRRYMYLPGKDVEVATLLTDSSDAADVTSVYAALHQSRVIGATHAYLLLHLPMDAPAVLRDRVNAVRALARELGVGVVLTQGIEGSPWEIAEAPEARPLDRQRISAFINTRLSTKTQERIMLATRS
ncbi:hypothetical protein [Kineococcus sp. SYSU DK006]|uniref:hypothetical protein n=1 Tax=Kineococcus sp. SYSU DK006 TaxID=3383127 RepID=UPI003D7D2398